MGSGTWRDSRRSCGSEESGNGARVWVEFARRCSVFWSPCARRKEEGEANGAASVFGQARGGFKARLRRQDAHGAWPARSGERRRVADTRRRFSETVGHGD